MTAPTAPFAFAELSPPICRPNFRTSDIRLLLYICTCISDTSGQMFRSYPSFKKSIFSSQRHLYFWSSFFFPRIGIVIISKSPKLDILIPSSPAHCSLDSISNENIILIQSVLLFKVLCQSLCFHLLCFHLFILNHQERASPVFQQNLISSLPILHLLLDPMRG